MIERGEEGEEGAGFRVSCGTGAGFANEGRDGKSYSVLLDQIA